VLGVFGPAHKLTPIDKSALVTIRLPGFLFMMAIYEDE